MRRQHIFISALALVAAACTTSAVGPTTSSSSTTSLVVTPTSTFPSQVVVVSPSRGTNSIEIWVPADLKSQVQETATAFETDTGISVEITPVEFSSVLPHLLADPASGPDVFVGPHVWLSTLTAMGIAEPLQAPSEIVTGALAAVTLRGVVFGIPLALDTIVQFRNLDALVAVPETIESLAAGCPWDGEILPCLLLPADSVDGHYPFIAGAGGYMFGPDVFDGWDADDVGIDTAETLAGGLILETIVDGLGILGDGDSSVVDRFVAGEAPLLWGNTETLATLTEMAAVDPFGVSFTVERLPSIAETTAPTPVRVTAAWVNAFSPGKEVALQFVTEYLGTSSSANAIALTLRMAPANIEFDPESELDVFIESAGTGDVVPTITEADYAWERLAVAFAGIREGGDSAEILSAAALMIRSGPELEASADEETDG